MPSLPVLNTMDAETSTASHSPQFHDTLRQAGCLSLTALGIETLQINVGKLCNQTCEHCHVDAGPTRTEIMTLDTIEAILAVLDQHPHITTVDITGGAPEMNPHFEYFVSQCHTMGRQIINRCNLTVLFMKGKEHLPQFLANHFVEIMASLPCYEADTVDHQRGKGVFNRSLAALRILNELGYGQEGSGLTLSLVYNPLGASLPPNQNKLEADYKKELETRFGIQFNRLYTITNMPISRFLNHLKASGQYEDYLNLLVTSFNPASVNGLMCRKLVNVGWDGKLYDCDFNQMLNMPLRGGEAPSIKDFLFETLANRLIVTGQHCYGCTAGAGSSCGGTLA
ncbi:MAG: radical SAM/Cys-rich domain protein [Nitrospirales bacterium]|nr:radical SAM/Cys-rich domain protein [Nitrospirales bacterium]